MVRSFYHRRATKNTEVHCVFVQEIHVPDPPTIVLPEMAMTGAEPHYFSNPTSG
jgi:hypothetical protein